MHIRSQQDFCAGIIFLVTGTVFVLGSNDYDMGTAGRMGPGYFPWILGLLTIVIGLLVTLKAVVFSAGERERIGPIAWRPLFFIIAANLVFGVMLGGLPSIGLPSFGLVAGVFALTLIAALASDEFRISEVLVLGAILATASVVGFVVLLNLQLQIWPAFLGLR